MKTLKTILSIALIAAMTACSSDSSSKAVDAVAKSGEEKTSTSTYAVDAAKSKLMWRGSMLNVKSHEGTLRFNKGSFTTDGDKLVSGSFEINMKTMSPTDDMYDEEKTKEGLVGHLSSPDFFDVANHPTASLEVKDGKAFLTVRGKTNEVEISNLKMEEKDGNMSASADMTFDRQKFGVTYSTGAADYLIVDDIVTRIEIIATKS